jgi:branched-chain amino acid transport system substrate-binding protein
MFSKRNLALILVALLTLAVLATVGGCAKGEDTYKIGAIFAITGPASPLGTPERDTAVMLEKQINEAGGINGKDVEIIIYDTKTDATEAVTATKRLLEQDEVLLIVGPSTSGESLALIDTMTQAETPLISCAASSKIVEPVSERKWIFKTPQTDVHAVGAIFEYMNGKGISKVAIMTASDGFGQPGREVLLKMAPDAGVAIVADEKFGTKDTSMQVQLTNIKGSDAQAMIVWGTNPGPALISKQANQIGLGIPVYNSHGIANKTFIEVAGDDANGVVFPVGKLLLAEELPDSDPQKQVLLDYKQDFQDEYDRTADTFGGHAWDAIQLAFIAIEKGGSDKAKIRDELEKIQDFKGTGGVFNLSPEDHIGLGSDAMMMVQIKNGEWAAAD